MDYLATIREGYTERSRNAQASHNSRKEGKRKREEEAAWEREDATALRTSASEAAVAEATSITKV